MQVFEIGRPDLTDNYKTPLQQPRGPYRPGSGEKWPMYQPSEADPEAGYRLHPREVVFHLPQVPDSGCLLTLDHLTIAPRFCTLHAEINGHPGRLCLNPRPSTSGEIHLLSGLHTTIYATESLRAWIPAHLLRQGDNLLSLTAMDGGEVLRLDHPERIARLDRMANGSGVIYQGLRLEVAEEVPLQLEVRPTVLYRDENGVLHNRVDGRVVWNGTPEPLTIELDGVPYPVSTDGATWGHSRFSVWTPAPSPEGTYRLGGLSGTFKRPRKWTVHVAAHAHTDIGYTHRQIEVAERQNRNLDAAIQFAENHTDFSCHLDSVWPLASYLHTRSKAQQDRLRRAFQQGKVHAAQNHADLLTQFAALEDLIRNQQKGQKLLGQLGASSRLAAVVDVASISSSVPDVLARSGVRYLIHANNQDRGPFRLNGRLHLQCPFYWQGPAGGKVLYWLSKMYCELRKVCGSPPVLDSAAQGLNTWLTEYEREDYLPDRVLLYGQEADNTDLDPQPGAFIQQWNATYAYPKLVSGNPEHFFEHLEEHWGHTFQTLQGDGGAYWEDGAITSLQETLQARQAQADLPAAEQLDALAALHDARLASPVELYDQAWDELLLYDEHTWGAFLSVTDPEARLQQDQWEVKSQFAVQARHQARQLLHGAASRHSLQWNTSGREVVVHNPHNFPVSSECEVEVALSEDLFCAGQRVPTREMSRTKTQKVLRFRAALEGYSYQRFTLQPDPTPPPRWQEAAGVVVLENGFYRVEVDTARACILRIHDLEADKALLGPQGAGTFVHVLGGEDTRITSNRMDLPDAELTLHEGFALQDAKLLQDPLGSTLRITGQHALGPLTCTVHLPNAEKAVEVQHHFEKAPTTEREAVYIKLDLADLQTLQSDSQLGWVDWQEGTLPGACQEWLPLQTALFKTGGVNTCVASPDVPLFCTGDVVRGRWPLHKDQRTGPVFLYAMNNYWHTNYPGQQGGAYTLRLRITSGLNLTLPDAYRFGWAARRPLYAQRISFQDFRDVPEVYQKPAGGTLMQVSGDVHVRTLKTTPDTLTLRLHNLSPEHQTAEVRVPHLSFESACLTDLHGGFLQDLPIFEDHLRVPLGPFDLQTVQVLFRRHP